MELSGRCLPGSLPSTTMGGGEEERLILKKAIHRVPAYSSTPTHECLYGHTYVSIYYLFVHVCVTCTETIICREEKCVSPPEYCCGGDSIRTCTTVFGNEKPPVWKTGKQSSRIYHYFLGMLGDQVMRLLFKKR